MSLNHSIMKDTIYMTLVDFILQGISLMVNVFLMKHLGENTLGIVSLMMSFYNTLVVVSNGNTFLCANRFISEERGKTKGNPSTILGYSVLWSVSLAVVCAIAVSIFSDDISNAILDNTIYSNGIKIVASTLILAATTSSVKGYFHAYRNISTPLVSGILEFTVKNSIIILMLFRCNLDIISTLGIAMVLGESVSLIFLMTSLIKHIRRDDTTTDTTFKRYAKKTIPIALNSSIPLILSTCNDALLPITLKECGSSSEEAFSLYGMFEEIVIPVIFFPSSILCSLACILVSEVARCNAQGNFERIRRVSFKAIKLTLIFSAGISIVFMIFGGTIVTIIGSTPLCGKIVRMLSPVVPLIYLEIILESILKGLGKHGFSSINYIAEYIIRISTLLICVPLFHFYGIVISYYVSNIVGNVSRIIMARKAILFQSTSRHKRKSRKTLLESID